MTLDADACYRALTARDARFDGTFYVGVKTTGVYCRPICPARTPGRERCVFFRRPAEAERDGFRACFRCRPELAPGGGPVDALTRLAAEAARRIDAGCLDDGSVDDLAAALGVTGRHLRRALVHELGVTPIMLAQSRRLAFAKQLLHDTALPLTEVAFASGFASVRRFNAAFRARFARPPGAVRRRQGAEAITLRLDYRPPLAWAPLVGFLGQRATAGVEEVAGGVYRRTVRIGAHAGWVAVRDSGHSLHAEVSLSLARAALPLVARLRRLFDLDAHPAAVDAVLGRDRRLAPLVRARPGLRVPGAHDGFEMAVRAILGQQVSVRAATTIAGRVATAFGEPIDTPFPALTRLAPTPEALAEAGVDRVAKVGLPEARARAVVALATAVSRGDLALDGSRPVGEVLETLVGLPGIGPWTAQYIAMRALAWPDAFPGGDLALRKLLDAASTRDAEAAAEPWRPWRAYGAIHVWTSLWAGG